MTAVAFVEASDPATFGGKSVELGRALRGGLPVPDGVALSVELVEAVAAGHTAAITTVHQVFARLGGGPVAARSSAVGEDGAAASFAGQHATKLNVVSAEGLVHAVAAVRASGHSDAALAYRKRAGIPGAPKVAVAVQRLIPSELAGVLFTRCPVTGRDERVVEAARGLGEVVVAGLINPERLRIDRTGRVLERSAADQDLMIVATAAGGTEERPVVDRRAAILDDTHVRELHELAVTCERVFGDGGHDVEFAFVKGSVFLLQRRPITR